MNETELQSQIIKRINDDGIYRLINNREEFISIATTISRDDFQRYFSINYIIREKYFGYSKIILEGLNSEIEIVNGSTIKNISLDYKEKLYPDIILYNYENSKYFILELKRSSKAEREAVTELLGYRLELKNHLPFINNGDIPLIIVSTEFNILLLHSVASLILDNIPILCLKPIISDDIFIGFDIVDISAWSNIGVESLNSQSFEGRTICLYGKDDNEINKDVIYDDLNIAVDILKNDANRIGSHGFCVIWENYGAKGISSQTATDYFISVFTINPYNIFYNDKNLLTKHDVLSEHINQTISETDAIFNTCKALSYCRNNSINRVMVPDEVLKLTDINWLIKQVKQSGDMHSDAVALIHIHEDKRISVEVSLEASDILLKKQLNDNQFILKISEGGIDISLIKSYDEILKLTLPPL